MDCVKYDNDNGVCSMHRVVVVHGCKSVCILWWRGVSNFGKISNYQDKHRSVAPANLHSPRRRQIIGKQFQFSLVFHASIAAGTDCVWGHPTPLPPAHAAPATRARLR